MEDDEAPGVPEWVVTYGDMMSLLLTFFIMLVSLSEVVADEKYRAILDSLHKYIGYREGPVAPPGKNFPLNTLIRRLETFSLASYVDEVEGHGGIKTQSIEGENVHVFQTREGTPLDVGRPISFRPWDDTLSSESLEQLRSIAAELAGKPNKIEIRGHASQQIPPPDARLQDKWVLSYSRAQAVLASLEELGIDHDRLRITAVADTEPLSAVGDRSEARNDRVEIRLLDTFAREYVGPRELPD